MPLPRLFGRQSEKVRKERVSTVRNGREKQVADAVEAGLYPVKVASRARIRVFHFVIVVAVLSFVGIFILSLFGFIDPIRQFVQPITGKAGGLVVSSEYAKVNVKLDGQLIGQSPFTGQDISAGNHMLSCDVITNTNNYFTTATIPITINPDNTTVVRLNPAPTNDLLSYTIISSQDRIRDTDPKLVVKAIPQDVSVKLDNEVMGRVPQTFATIAAGAHQLLLEKQGYRPTSVDVTIADDKIVTVEVRMYQYQVTIN